MIIYLGGMDTKEGCEALYRAKTPHVLSSFFYARKVAGAMRNLWLATLRQASLRFADSGAFTMRTFALADVGSRGSKDVANVDFDKFLHEYVEWVRALSTAGLVDYWVELDIGVITGGKWVHAQREKFHRAGLAHGLVNVWHSREHDWEYWLDLLRESRRHGRSRYVAIEGHQRWRDKLEYSKYLTAAYRRGVRVHGFRLTAIPDLHGAPWFSVDSTTWTVTGRYGALMSTSPAGGIVQHSARRTRGNAGEVGTSNPLAFKAPVPARMNATERRGVLLASARAWIDAEAHLADLWRARGVDWSRAVESPEEADVGA